MKDPAQYQIIRLADMPELKERAALWFSEKWSVPTEAYLESIEDSFKSVVPSWYVCLDEGKIIAGRLLDFVCSDMASKGIRTLYLLTDHTSFYERYGWEFHCLAMGDGEDKPSRLYIHRQEQPV